MSSSPQPNLTNGFNQLYNQIFCNLFQSTTNNGFATCDNCNFNFPESDGVLSNNATDGQQSCLNLCNNNEYCTAYTFLGSNSGNTSSNNCILYGTNNQYPSQINSGVIGSYSGYAITDPKASFSYNNLNSTQQDNVKLKCANQFLNNTYTPNQPSVDITSCISFNDDSSGGKTKFNVDPQCLFNIYQQNNIPVKIKNETNYTNNSGISTESIGDETITNYENNYNKYMQLKEENSLENRQALSTDNANYPTYFQTLNSQNQILGNSFLGNISTGNSQLSNLFSQIKQTIGTNNIENFENNNNNNNKFLLIILLIFFVLIILFFVFNKK